MVDDAPEASRNCAVHADSDWNDEEDEAEGDGLADALVTPGGPSD
ncbi:hypothetical protein ACG7TL_002834 [Trametes sanguinea]